MSDTENDFEDMEPDGQCMAAGSEYCDWSCPMRHSEFYVGSAAWNRKHGVKPDV